MTINPEHYVLNPLKLSKRIYLWLAECVNAIDDLSEVESDATQIDRLEGGRAGARVTLYSNRFEYEILCEHSYCSVQLILVPLEGGRPQVIFSGDCTYHESWLRVYAYVLVAEQYTVDETDHIKRLLVAAFGSDLFKTKEEDNE